MNMFYESDIYRTYFFDLLSGNLNLIEKENSSHPIYFNGNVYYILIDNSHQVTKIINFKEIIVRAFKAAVDRSKEMSE